MRRARCSTMRARVPRRTRVRAHPARSPAGAPRTTARSAGDTCRTLRVSRQRGEAMKTTFYAAMMVLTVGLVTVLHTRASAPTMTKAALATAFDSGIKNVVVEWDPADV